MDRKRLYRSWWLWAVVIIIFAIFVLPSLSGGSDYHSVSTSDAIAQIDAGNVTKAVMHDKEQSLTLDLKAPFENHRKISASYPADASATIFNDLKSHSGTDFTTKVSKSNLWLSLLASLLPILLIVGVLFFVMSQVQAAATGS